MSKEFRKIFSRITAVLLAVMLLNSQVLAFGNPFKRGSKPCKKSAQIVDYSIPLLLENRIKTSIIAVYGEDQLETIYPKVQEIIKHAKQNRPLGLYEEDFTRPSDWYKDEIIYMFYVDQFGVSDRSVPNTFKDCINMFDYLEDLGVTTIYMLPFIDSPMGDGGFDIQDPKNIRQNLGGIREFNEFLTEARKRGFKIKADLVLNHFSDQHEWFQQALEGNAEKADYFVNRKELPEYERCVDEKTGVFIEYKEDDGQISKRSVVFPEICENHFRKVNINGEDRYFYHTFYPFQIDVNWQNPEVLYYMLDLLGYWANVGVDIFRMDAIPYYIKRKGTTSENLEDTHKIVELLSAFLQAVGSKSVIQAETCQYPKDILPYFGNEETVKLDILPGAKKELKRTDEVQIAYHFPIMPAIWSSLITADSEHFWKVYDRTPQIPDTAAWAVFLRVHDELTLQMVEPETRKLIYNELVQNGAEFRKGFGVSGRMANFLENKPDRIALGFSILMSIPGVPIIYYGDEIGAQNNWRYAKATEAQREEMAKEKGVEEDVISFFDSRDINRGPITRDDFYDAQEDDESYGGEIYKRVKQLVHLRKEHPTLRRGSLARINTDKNEVFAYLRTSDDEQLMIVHNLSGNTVTANVELPEGINKTTLKDIISGEQFYIKTLLLKPYESLWLQVK